jgi:DNA-directed RNA polymerase subunit RPC12/RpoP
MPRPPQPQAAGARVQVELDDADWYAGWVVGRRAMPPVEPGDNDPPVQQWVVQFDDGQLVNDIEFDHADYGVRFDGVGRTVELRFGAAGWQRGRLVDLLKDQAGAHRGILFEDGAWVEDVDVDGEDFRYVDAAGPPTTIPKTLAVKRARGSEDLPPTTIPKTPPVKRARGSKDPSPHVCQTCGKVMGKPSSLKLHMLTHTGERPHVCSTCGKRFSTRTNLTAHLRTHTGERPHVCETCGKGFATHSVLRLHLRTHTGERPYVCEMCGKACTTAGDLVKHARTHSGERPYVCETCGKGFSQGSALAVHIRTHTGERSHVCETCGKTFTTPGQLRVHMRQVHSVDM